MGPNDVITLRFESASGQTQVSPKALARLADALCGVVSAVAGISGRAPSQNELVLVAPPRRGSLLFTLQPLFQIDLDLQAIFNLHFGSRNPPPPSFLGEARDWSMFFWSVAFGGTGIYQMAKGRARMAWVKISDQPTENPPPTTDQVVEREIAFSVTHKALNRKRVVSAIERLTEHATALGYTKIEICVRDDDPVRLDHDA